MFHVFQSTHPSGVRPEHRDKFAGSIKNFNPRTPVGCDLSNHVSLAVSSGFQSTHPSGVRPQLRELTFRVLVFQSTHPSGVRQGVPRGLHAGRRISIHAPQWGATWRDLAAHIAQSLFQSTHPSGVRQSIKALAPSTRNFNPRTPVGCDRTGTWWARPAIIYFNPRTPVGCDTHRTQSAHFEIISIHAPQWGATRYDWNHFDTYEISIHAPQWGATSHPHGWLFQCPISIHAPQWGATRLISDEVAQANEFQSTHPSGVRRTCSLAGVGPCYFNPRTPVGCDGVGRKLHRVIRQFQSTHPSGVRRS